MRLPSSPMRARLVASMVLGVLTVGCGSSTPGTAGNSPAASPSPLTASPSPQPCTTQPQPPGTPGTFSETNGTATFTLSIAGCKWSLAASGQTSPIDGSWTYSTSTSQVSFTEAEGLCGPATGVYKWAFAGDTLTMTKVSDTCSARSDQFDGRAWRKS